MTCISRVCVGESKIVQGYANQIRYFPCVWVSLLLVGFYMEGDKSIPASISRMCMGKSNVVVTNF